MEIGPLSNRQPGTSPEGGANRRPETSQTPQARSKQTTDRVEISVTARARLADLADKELAREKSEPQPIGSEELPHQERLDQIRVRIASGYYNDPSVRSKIVDRLIDDLDS